MAVRFCLRDSLPSFDAAECADSALCTRVSFFVSANAFACNPIVIRASDVRRRDRFLSMGSTRIHMKSKPQIEPVPPLQSGLAAAGPR